MFHKEKWHCGNVWGILKVCTSKSETFCLHFRSRKTSEIYIYIFLTPVIASEITQSFGPSQNPEDLMNLKLQSISASKSRDPAPAYLAAEQKLNYN